MGALLERIASPSALADSWKRVLANDAEDDVLSAGYDDSPMMPTTGSPSWASAC